MAKVQCNVSVEKSRYSRQIILSEIGVNGQEKLKDGRVLVVGAGGLGCPVLLYLTGAGIGTIGIIDDDIVELSNLHRQILYSTLDIGSSKVLAAKQRINQLNPDVVVNTFVESLTSENIELIFSEYDVIVDATDNFKAKYLISDACVRLGKIVVYASINQFEGQVSVFNYLDQETQQRGPCFRDIFETPPPPYLTQNCAESGVIGVVPGLIGCIQANEVIKIILSAGEILSGVLLSIDCMDNNFNLLSINKKARNSASWKTLADVPVLKMDENYKLTPEILHNWIEKKEDFRLVDVREADEHQQNSIGGALIPLREIIRRLNEIESNRRVVFYCKSGIRSFTALKTVRGLIQGVQLYYLEGGIELYQAYHHSKARTSVLDGCPDIAGSLGLKVNQ
ncbi:HesA/MoeB/ThiF family protein [Pseudomonas sp. RIT-To-2]|uniref:HesA/MoeB/ThiF family protein n=1 Tax=Pseudomonas sp. RIT-To-2 TaxID=3462541 RepID=UPI002413CA71